jgi:hypothetical protein
MSKPRTSIKSIKRQEMQARRRRQRLTSYLVWGALGVGVVAVIGFLAWQAFRPARGEDVPIPPNYETHIEVGTPPGPFPSDPPAGGVHYSETLPARFYQESDLESLPEYPEGYLVHNLEHGYVIFWYNCENLDETACEQLKGEIQGVLDQFDGVKVMAFPWTSLAVPVAATSWGRLQRFETFNTEQAAAFVRANRNRAPEPNAP